MVVILIVQFAQQKRVLLGMIVTSGYLQINQVKSNKLPATFKTTQLLLWTSMIKGPQFVRDPRHD